MKSIRIFDEDEVTPEIDAAIRRGLCECFPADVESFSRTRAWHGSAPSFSALMEDDGGRIMAHVGMVDRQIRCGATPLRVAGVQNVFVVPDYRGKGYADAVLNAAIAEAKKRSFDAGLLFCVPALERTYSRCGWQSLGERETIRIDEAGQELPIPGKNIAMFYPLRMPALPLGSIHLQGNDW